ncbi:MAG TPA: hypothetical protein VHI93_03040 [Candidatus Thermoplasmatota archaeon]|nr:hypothetical protein [Candidatus Thermoplasmatota archaeon]
MTSRSCLDTPAAAICLVFGLLVVGVSLPFAIQALPEAVSSYDIAWRERAASQDLTIPSQTGTYRASVTVTGLASSLTIDPSVACADNFRAPLQSPATLAFRVTKTMGGMTSTAPDWAGTYTCAGREGAKRTIQLAPHPDVASASASDTGIATRSAWAGVANETATYTLEVTPSRPADTVPVGAAAPTSLTATVRLTVSLWEAVATPHTPEAVK